MVNDKYRIVVLINSIKLGGAEKVVQTLVHSLADFHEIHLVTLEKQEFYEVDERIRVVNLSERTGDESNLSKLFYLIRHARELKKYVKSMQIDTVLSHLYRSNYVNVLAKLFGGGHHAQVVDHTLPNRLYGEGRSGRINLMLIKSLYRFADASVSVTKKVQDQLKSIAKLPQKAYIIHNPFDIDRIKKLASEEIVDLEFKPDFYYLVTVGRVNCIKRHDLIIEALNKLNNEKIYLIIIGKEEGVRVDDLVRMSNFENNIIWLGEKANPYKYIRHSDALVLASDSESFGNVLVESMICETPVISTDCGGPGEIIINGENGILVDTGDASQLAVAISGLLGDQEKSKKFVRNASKTLGEFSLGSITEQYRAVLGWRK